MTRINLKINISNLKSVTQWQKGETGPVECLIIPIDANYLFRGKSGLYLDLTAFEIRNPKEGQKDTHVIKQSLPKEVYETLTDEEKKAMPIMGNAMVMDVQGSNMPPTLDEGSDLPFN
jgi:hypothetical protein